MERKTDIIRDALARGDNRKAISVASRFFDRGADTQLFKQAQGAVNNPQFYRQIGKNPDAIIAAAIARLNHRFPA